MDSDLPSPTNQSFDQQTVLQVLSLESRKAKIVKTCASKCEVYSHFKYSQDLDQQPQKCMVTCIPEFFVYYEKFKSM